MKRFHWKQVRALDEPFRFQDKSDWHWLKRTSAGYQCWDDCQDSVEYAASPSKPFDFHPKPCCFTWATTKALDCLAGMQGEELPIVPEVRSMLYDLRTFRCFLIGYSRCASVNRSSAP